MAQIKLMKFDDTEEMFREMDSTADEITLLSFTVNAGPVLSGTGLDLNNTNISEIDDLSFNDATSTITNQDGTFEADDLMFDSKENIMESGSAILFNTITDVADDVDAFRLPALAGAPSATPTDGGEGYLVWDSSNDNLYAWDGASWKNLSIVSQAERVCFEYTAGEAIAQADVLYISAANTVSKADTSSAATVAESRVVGVAGAAALAAAAVPVCSDGVVSGFTGLTPGAIYFQDPATPGGVTDAPSTVSGNRIVQVGIAKSTTEMHLQIDRRLRRA